MLKTADWREVVSHPDVDIVAELVGGTTVAREIIDGAIAQRQIRGHGQQGTDGAVRLGDLGSRDSRRHQSRDGSQRRGGIPIHAVLREGISGDRVTALYGILNGTSNYILTEMEKRGDSLATVLAEAQRLGYAEADPSADVDGFDARSKLAILAALAFGEKITPADIYMEGIRRISPHGFPVCARSWTTPSA